MIPYIVQVVDQESANPHFPSIRKVYKARPRKEDHVDWWPRLQDDPANSPSEIRAMFSGDALCEVRDGFLHTDVDHHMVPYLLASP
jgi:hypothetical protein